MNRRRYLTVCAAAAVAGCATEDDPGGGGQGPTPTTALAQTYTPIEPDSDGEATPSELLYALVNDDTVYTTGVEFTGLELRDDELHLTYEMSASDLNDEHAVHITGTYAAYVEQNGPGERLVSHVNDRFGDPLATWFIERTWIEQWNNGEVDDRDVIDKVLGTVERAG